MENAGCPYQMPRVFFSVFAINFIGNYILILIVVPPPPPDTRLLTIFNSHLGPPLTPDTPLSTVF